MWFFDRLANAFWSLGDWLDYAGRILETIPIIGTYGGAPFRQTALFFDDCAQAAQNASSWADSIASTASAAYSNALNAYNYAYGWLTQKANNAWNTATSAYNYAYGWLTQKANDAWNTATDAYNYAYGWLTTALNNLAATFWSQINAVNTWKDGFISTFWSQINAINTWKNEIIALIPTQKTVTDWIESSLGYLTTKAIALVTANARTFADPLWYLLDAVVGKLSEWEGK